MSTTCHHGLAAVFCYYCDIEKEYDVSLTPMGNFPLSINERYLVRDKNKNELGIINPTNTTKDEFIEKVKELKEGKNVP